MGKVGQTTGGRIRAAVARMGSAVRRFVRSPRRYWRAWQFGWGLLGLCLTGVVIVTVLVAVPWGCTPKPEPEVPARQGRSIRVRVMAGVDAVWVTASRPPFYHSTADGQERILNLPANVPMAVVWTAGDGWRCGVAKLGKGDLVLRPASLGTLRVDGDKAYRGQLRLVSVGDGKIDVVNDVELDDYLKGVIAKELYPSWHEEAFKAQAIAARTYALYEIGVHRSSRHFDVHADTRSQVYAGLGGETAKSRMAVEATAGIVAAYGTPGQERIFKAYFSACCGGVTQSNADAFAEPFVAPLSEQAVGTLCSASSRYAWGPVVLTKEELTRRFRAWGRARGRAEATMAPVRSVEISARNRFRRPVRYLVTDAAGRRYAWTSEELRWAVNYDAPEGSGPTLYSGFVETIVNESDRVRFTGGRGYGHGVGMCQWCAQARAAAGMRHEDIVLAAFPGSRLMRAY